MIEPTTVRVIVGKSTAGSPVFEEVLVEPFGDWQYRLLKSPGLTLGLAADDVFQLNLDGTFTVLKRGSNVCIQLFTASKVDVEMLQSTATEFLAPLGGRLDGKTPNVLVYSVPVRAGFPSIEMAMAAIMKRMSGAEWYYGNVYDPKDGITPLNWW